MPLKKLLDKSEICMDAMVKVYNRVLDGGQIVNGWKESRTIMIPKKAKPGPHEHRPIALTNIGYKIFIQV